MKTQTKRLLLALVLFGMMLSLFTANIVMASTNGTTYGDHQRERDRIQDCDSCTQNDGICPNACDGAGAQQQYQYGSTCEAGCASDISMHQACYRYQYEHRNNQGR